MGQEGQGLLSPSGHLTLAAIQPSPLAPGSKDRGSKPWGAPSHVSLVRREVGLLLSGIKKRKQSFFPPESSTVIDSSDIKGTFLHFLNQLLCVLGL